MGRARIAARSSVRRASWQRYQQASERCPRPSTRTSNSARTGTASSAAAVGVGARTSAAKSISVTSVSWPTAAISGIMLAAAARTTISSLNDHKSSSEPPPRATMSRSGRRIGPSHGKRVEALDGGGDLLGGAFALHAHRPHQHVAREAVGKPMQDVADDGAGRRGDDADQFRQERQQLLSRRVEQAFGGELFLALLDQRHQRAEPGGLQRLDHDLVFRLTGIGGQAPGDEDFEPFLGLEAHAAERGLPDHRLDLGAFVLQREIAVAGGVRSAVAGDFAAHAHIAEGVLDGLLERRRELGDGPFRER